jgi:dolichol-phosphate mannosyltransferase
MTLTIAAMPAYNEANRIANVILGCRKYVDKVVVVDDGSCDNTAELAESLGAYVVRHETNKGYGAALKNCFETARKLDANAMVIIDSDGQHNPNEIPKLLEPLKNGFDLVIGSRFVNGNGKNVPGYRKMGMKVLDVATSFAGGLNVTDSQSGFRAYGKKAIEKINLSDSDMSAGSEILIQAKDHKLKYTEVEVHCRYDLENTSSQNPFVHGPKVLLRLLKDMEYKRPLYYFTAPGMFMSAIGLSLGLKLLYDFYYGGSLSFGPTFLMALLIIVGMFMVFTGIILHAMGRMVRQISNMRS